LLVKLQCCSCRFVPGDPCIRENADIVSGHPRSTYWASL
jgi:hypothetical protein